MISADTSVLVEYMRGAKGADIDLLDKAMDSARFAISPIVICELLSDYKLSEAVIKKIMSLPVLEIYEGYWRRAGFMRAKLISKKLRARTADSLVAQSCIDHNMPLITRDVDFRHFEKHCGLKIIKI